MHLNYEDGQHHNTIVIAGISGFTNGSYQYDANGNQTYDQSKGLNLSYNHLNLPQTISKPSTSETMTNTWLASGSKLRKVVGSLMRDYVGGIEYNNGSIEFIQTEEGRAVPTGTGSYTYDYILKDHLGNTRVLLRQDGQVLETNDYHPFGQEIIRAGQTVTSPENRFKYNGKELQTELGLNQLDYGARFYDANLGRWSVIDPLAEHYDNLTGYGYVSNNPLRYIDLAGMTISDPFGIISSYETDLNQTNQSLDELIKSGNLPSDLVGKLKAFISNEFGIIKDLRKSSQLYEFGYQDGTGGSTYWNGAKNSVMTDIGKGADSKNQMAIIAHELTHDSQFQHGQISFITNDPKTIHGSLYDLTDEGEAYQAEHFRNYGLNAPTTDFYGKPAVDKSGNPINNYVTPLDIVKTLNGSYSKLSTTPIGLNSAEGKKLRAKTIDAGRNGTVVSEVYIGWQNDYQKGIKSQK